jgi:hypothetical protein
MSIKKNRAHALFAIRNCFGFSSEAIAKKLGVTPRTVGLWETMAQPMPDGPWRLFVHEMKDEIFNEPSIVVVLAEDGVTPIDAVSDQNFVFLDKHADGTAIIASHAIDRYTQRPTLHSQRFQQHANQHVIRAAEAWEAGLRIGASTGEKSMLAAHRWLTHRVLKAEQQNPKLREMKDAITAASDAVDRAHDAESKALKLEALDAAVQALIREIEKT